MRPSRFARPIFKSRPWHTGGEDRGEAAGLNHFSTCATQRRRPPVIGHPAGARIRSASARGNRGIPPGCRRPADGDVALPESGRRRRAPLLRQGRGGHNRRRASRSTSRAGPPRIAFRDIAGRSELISAARRAISECLLPPNRTIRWRSEEWLLGFRLEPFHRDRRGFAEG